MGAFEPLILISGLLDTYLRVFDGTKVDDDGGEEEDEDGEGEGDQPPTAIGSTASV